MQIARIERERERQQKEFLVRSQAERHEKQIAVQREADFSANLLNVVITQQKCSYIKQQRERIVDKERRDHETDVQLNERSVAPLKYNVAQRKRKHNTEYKIGGLEIHQKTKSGHYYKPRRQNSQDEVRFGGL